MVEPRNYTRGHLPHRSVPGATQFLTWRLHDALTPEQWDIWKATYRGEEDAPRLHSLAERHLDRHEGSAYFRTIPVGRLVMERLFEEQRDAYRLLAAVVMPNHVHAVLHFGQDIDLGEVMRRIKGSSAREINLFLRRTGRLWLPDYFDRTIRSSGHLERCIGYVHWNPVKAGLCDDPRAFANSTANPYYAERLRTEGRGPKAG